MSGLIHESLFFELTALLAVAALVGFVGHLLRQPLIVSFIATGILVGPIGLGISAAAEHLRLLAELGVTLLLFLVGLKLDLHLVRTLGRVALTTGLGQVIFTSVVGFAICLALGLDALSSLYVAVALTFSSTIIIVKLLTDKKELDELHGRVALGFLIVQDIVVVLALVVLSALGIGAAGTTGPTLPLLVGGALLIAGLVWLMLSRLAEPMLRRIVRVPELMVVTAIAWAALLAAIGDVAGFGKELGALLAGVALASTSYREAVLTRLGSLRDFLLLFFFIVLGAGLDLQATGAMLIPAILLSLFVLIGNPLIVMIIMGVMGYRKRTGFLAGLTVAQISEFSLIFIGAGFALGHVDDATVGLVTLVGLITIAGSTYLILYSKQLYARIEPWLSPFERREPMAELGDQPLLSSGHDVVVIGLGRLGEQLARLLDLQGLSVLGVDLDPQIVERWQREGRAARLGDVLDPDLLLHVSLDGTRWIVDAAPVHRTGVTHADHRAALIKALRSIGYTGKIAVVAEGDIESERMHRLGADLVLRPFREAAIAAARQIADHEGGDVASPEPEAVRASA